MTTPTQVPDQRDEKIVQLSQALHAAQVKILKLTASNERLTRTNGELLDRLSFEQDYGVEAPPAPGPIGPPKGAHIVVHTPVEVDAREKETFATHMDAIQHMLHGGMIGFRGADGLLRMRRIHNGVSQVSSPDGRRWRESPLDEICVVKHFFHAVTPTSVSAGEPVT